MNALRMGLDVAVDTIREVASKYEDSGPSTSGYGVGPPKIESGAYSTGRMQGFGRDGSRHQMEAPSDSTAYREREVERTATGAPKVESGYYSTGKMRGFGSNDVRPNYPKPGSALDRQWNGGGAERADEGWTRNAGPEGGFIRSSAAGGGGGGSGGGGGAVRVPGGYAVPGASRTSGGGGGYSGGGGGYMDEENGYRGGGYRDESRHAAERIGDRIGGYRGGYVSREAYDRDERVPEG